MTTVQEATAAEATRLKQKAAHLVAAELCDLGLPVAFVSVDQHDGSLSVSLRGYGNDAVPAVRAAFMTWAAALGVEEFTDADLADELELSARVTYNGVPVRLSAYVRGVFKTVKTRTVTR